MKLLFSVLILLAYPLGNVAAASEEKLRDLTVSIANVDPSGIIKVRIHGSLTEKVKIWRDSNAWGAARWRVILLRGGDAYSFYENPDQMFTRNFPAFDEIPSNQFIERTLDLRDGNWIGPDIGRVGFREGDSIVVIYDVPATSEARKMDVWYGVAIGVKFN